MKNQKPQVEPGTEPSVSTGNDPQVSTNTEPSGSIEPQASSAADRTAEDTLEEYRSLLKQMEAQNKALLEQNRSLQSQFGMLIRSGAHVGQHGSGDPVSGSGIGSLLDPVQDSGQDEPQEPYVSLAELGKEIGKRDYGSHNTKKE